MAAEQKAILESIRDIIASGPEKGGDDGVLDLTSKLNADGSVTKIVPKHQKDAPAPKAEAPKPAPVAAAPAPKKADDDILSEIDSLLQAPATPAIDKKVELEFTEKTQKFEITEEFEKTPEPEPTKTTKEQVMDNPQEASFEPQISPRDTGGVDAILSDAAASEASAALSELMSKTKTQKAPTAKAEPSAPFRSGATVEDLVIEMLKPQMKEWLDKNLPILVKEMVQKEISKLIPKE